MTTTLNLKDPTLLRQQAFIAGAWVDADNGETVPVTNPATGEVLGTVPMCGTAETVRAIAAATIAIALSAPALPAEPKLPWPSTSG